MKVKLFHCNCPLRNPKINGEKCPKYKMFENEMNAWLEEHPDIKVSRIEQSASGGSFSESLWLISVWYE
jgi:hypothetical protein